MVPGHDAAPPTISAATKRLHAATARCHALRLLEPGEMQRIKALLKRGSRKRFPGNSLYELVGSYERLSTDLEQRVATASTADCSTEGSRPPPEEQLDLKRQELVSKRWALICLLDTGTGLQEALSKAGLQCSRRTVRNIIRRYRAEGYAGLVDKRVQANRRRRPSRMTAEVEQLVMRVWLSRPAAGPKAVWRAVVKELEASQKAHPSYVSVWRFLNKQKDDIKALRAGKLEVVRKTMRAVVRVQFESRANARFQIDHTQLDIWIKVESNGQFEPSPVWCTAVLDEYSRSIAGFCLTADHPDSWVIALALRHAILPKKREGWLNRGIPDLLQTDRGRDFMSAAIGTACAGLNISIVPDPPHNPDAKGKIERAFATLDSGCIRILPGHKAAIGVTQGAARKRLDELLTLQVLKQEIETWIVDDYHRRIHRELGVSPSERWLATIDVPRMPLNEEHLNLLLLQTDVRRVQNTGIEFRRRTFWSPMLAGMIKGEVRLRYDPDDDESVLVYSADTNAFICEAHRMGGAEARFTPDDVLEARSSYQALLMERMKLRSETLEREGRAKAMKKLAVSKAAELTQATASASAGEEATSGGGVQSLLEKLRDKRAAEVPGWSRG